MKSQFKIGDWVRRITTDSKNSGIIFQIEKISTDKVIDDKEKFLESSKYRVQEKLCEHWQPKNGEWCWVSDFNHKGSIPELRQFSRMEGDSKVFLKENGMEVVYTFVEPFVYDLPTVIKG